MRAALQAAVVSGLFEVNGKQPRAVACRKSGPNCPLAGVGIPPIYRLIGPDRGRYLAIAAPNSFSPFICFGVIRTGSDVAGRKQVFRKEGKQPRAAACPVDGDGERNVFGND